MTVMTEAFDAIVAKIEKKEKELDAKEIKLIELDQDLKKRLIAIKEREDLSKYLAKINELESQLALVTKSLDQRNDELIAAKLQAHELKLQLDAKQQSTKPTSVTTARGDNLVPTVEEVQVTKHDEQQSVRKPVTVPYVNPFLDQLAFQQTGSAIKNAVKFPIYSPAPNRTSESDLEERFSSTVVLDEVTWDDGHVEEESSKPLEDTQTGFKMSNFSKNLGVQDSKSFLTDYDHNQISRFTPKSRDDLGRQIRRVLDLLDELDCSMTFFQILKTAIYLNPVTLEEMHEELLKSFEKLEFVVFEDNDDVLNTIDGAISSADKLINWYSQQSGLNRHSQPSPNPIVDALRGLKLDIPRLEEITYGDFDDYNWTAFDRLIVIYARLILKTAAEFVHEFDELEIFPKEFLIHNN